MCYRSARSERKSIADEVRSYTRGEIPVGASLLANRVGTVQGGSRARTGRPPRSYEKRLGVDLAQHAQPADFL